jgi:hypothetical protein
MCVFGSPIKIRSPLLLSPHPRDRFVSCSGIRSLHNQDNKGEVKLFGDAGMISSQIMTKSSRKHLQFLSLQDCQEFFGWSMFF